MKRFIYQNNNKDLKYTGVYSILLNNNIYIGSTSYIKGFKVRFNKHKQDLLNNKHHSIYLQNSFLKYKNKNVIFQILHICEPNDCLKWEQFYIDLLNPKYNICKIAGSNKGYKKTKIQIENHKKSLKNYYKSNISSRITLNKTNLRLLIKDINLGYSRSYICEKYNIKKSTFYNIKNNNYPYLDELDIKINKMVNNLKRNGSSKYKGISFNRKCNKWQLEYNNKYIGLFETENIALQELIKLDNESRINK